MTTHLRRRHGMGWHGMILRMDGVSPALCCTVLCLCCMVLADEPKAVGICLVILSYIKGRWVYVCTVYAVGGEQTAGPSYYTSNGCSYVVAVSGMSFSTASLRAIDPRSSDRWLGEGDGGEGDWNGIRHEVWLSIARTHSAGRRASKSHITRYSRRRCRRMPASQGGCFDGRESRSGAVQRQL
ncbi:uncharacterized protein K489DRAFT_242846 [Dissoconium aciculare CBS 342.82]|uniref:Uncharacterized protein n=1 Tax=Dissoconium aciculare CBS 342.82 TaxID=1314786 RepID=A0A6J3M368_9PEZI|nr:uncharacterized protein K489DRAFT_242846 [Dissoconium aciculare CBS 342.82]KAF1822435.1 hypothetical protein K489DRAFT_242846 [Dissoconium aciculare CBS 342.82]